MEEETYGTMVTDKDRMKPDGYPLPKLRTLFVTKFLPLEEACRLQQGGKHLSSKLCLEPVLNVLSKIKHQVSSKCKPKRFTSSVIFQIKPSEQTYGTMNFLLALVNKDYRQGNEAYGKTYGKHP